MNECKRCSKLFTPGHNTKGLYCSRSCSVSETNKERWTNAGRLCVQCGEKFKTKTGRIYCSDECLNISRLNRALENPSLPNGELKYTVKRELIRRAGDMCSECGWDTPNPTLGRPILTVDHIDGNWKNNSIDNLKVLCYNCHTLTPTFGRLNQNGSFSERRAGKRTKSEYTNG